MTPRRINTQFDAALLEALVSRSRLFVILRLVGALVLLPGLGALLYAGGDTGWRPNLIAGLVGLVLLSVMVERQQSRLTSGHRLIGYAALLLVAHSVVIAVTGGVESPVLPVYIPATVVFAVAAGRRDTLALNLGALTTVVFVFLLIRLNGGDIGVPAVLRSGAAAPLDPRALILMASAVIALMCVGGGLGLGLRARLDQAAADLIDARAETVAAVQAQNRDLATLSAALAHELKNPLAAIQSLAGLVARKLSTETREAEHMAVLQGEVKRLGSILNEFLNLSRPVDGLNASSHDPAALVTGVGRLYEGAFRDQGVTLKLHCGACEPVVCDPRKVRQVIINLVENALEHSTAGGLVEVSLEAADGFAQVTVVDDGPGPSSAALERAFEAGFTSRAEGTGLGLTVARAIARQHGGEVILESREAGGAKSTLTLPLAPPSALPLAPQLENT